MQNILLNNLYANNWISILGITISIINALCVLIIILAVILNFIEDKNQEKSPVKEKKSIVETGTMTLFFIFVYIFIKFHIGTFVIKNIYLEIFFSFFGTVVMIIGTYFNIVGRLQLGKNWANQIKIYKKHTLVTSGVYSIVRHPLYASLIWMFYAGCLVFLNYAAFIATSLIFVPFMYLRAKQEEKLLKEKFPEYTTYQKKVGMFFPKI